MKTRLKKINTIDPIYILLPYAVFLLTCFLYRSGLGYQVIMIAILTAAIMTGVKVCADKEPVSLMWYALFNTAIALVSYYCLFTDIDRRMEGTLILGLGLAVFTMPARPQPTFDTQPIKE